MKRKFFTLVELLLVISIIALLAGLLLPVISKVKDNAKKLKAKSEARGLVLAIKSYESTYGLLPWSGAGDISWPAVGNVPANVPWDGTSADKYDTLLQILTKVDMTAGGIGGSAYNKSSLGNSRNIKFLDASNDFATKGYIDPWGNRYGIALDLDYDNKVKIDGTNDVNGTVFVWSFGPPTNAGLSLFTNSYGSSPNLASWQE